MTGVPFAPEIAPGLPLYETTQTFASAASFIVSTWTIPGNGIWLCCGYAKINHDANNMCVSNWTINYFRGSANVLARVVGAGPSFTTSGSLTPNAFTVNNPLADGTFTINIGWGSGTNQPVTATVQMRRLIELK